MVNMYFSTRTPIRHCKQGFTLGEVITATVVMSMILLSVISFVDLGSEIWKHGQETINSRNYQRTIFELIKLDMLQTTQITEPPASLTAQISEKHITYSVKTPTNLDYKIERDSHNLLKRTCLTDPAYSLIIARNIASFTATRISTWSVEIYIEIESEADRSGEIETLFSDSMLFMAPGAGG